MRITTRAHLHNKLCKLWLYARSGRRDIKIKVYASAPDEVEPMRAMIDELYADVRELVEVEVDPLAEAPTEAPAEAEEPA